MWGSRQANFAREEVSLKEVALYPPLLRPPIPGAPLVPGSRTNYQ